jgi:hypothetical protein
MEAKTTAVTSHASLSLPPTTRYLNYLDGFAVGYVSPPAFSLAAYPGATRLLDLGGSHGLHSIAFCRRYPGLDAVIVDLPTALTKTRATLVDAALSERIRLREGNLLDGDWALNNGNWQWLSCSNFYYQYFKCYSPVAFAKKYA